MATFKKKNILITGARFFTALDLARSLHMAGHEVFVADSHKIHLCALSKCITKSFTIPSPRFAFEDFQKKLKEIIIDYQIDMVIPIFEETLYLAKAKPNLPINCEVFCSPLAVLDKLHNKWLFYNLQKNLDIKTIPTKLIQSEEDLKKIDISKDYILKLCYSRGCFFVQKLSKDKPLPSLKIDPDNPYIAQQWVDGKKYCSYSVCRDGKVTAHALYSNETEDASYCLNFESLENKKIFQWVKDFAKTMHLTGQFSFDFIEAADGSLYVIECKKIFSKWIKS